MTLKRALTSLIAIGSLLALPAQAGDSAKTKPGDHWFYAVKTMSTDPAKDAEFNAWYDDIDIPDVLDVDGFMRARRAKLAAVDGRPEPAQAEGNYIALYDIETNDIDKTIIDLYVAARKMNALGRSTDLLKVTEANYYHRLRSVPAPTFESGAEQFVLTQKVLCCAKEKDRDAFVKWFERQFEPEIEIVSGLSRVELYELYRVMEPTAMKPEELPHMLVVYEMNSAASARAVFDKIDELQATGALPASFVEGDDTALYRRFNEVYSK